MDIPQSLKGWVFLAVQSAAHAAPIALYAAATAGTSNSLDVVEAAGRSTYEKVLMSFGEVAAASALVNVALPPKTDTDAALKTAGLVAAYDYYQFEDAKAAAITAAAVGISTVIGRQIVYPLTISALANYGLLY